MVEKYTYRKEPIPEPLAEKQFSGKFMVRVSPELHRELATEAQEAMVSLNRYVSNKLASRNTIIQRPNQRVKQKVVNS